MVSARATRWERSRSGSESSPRSCSSRTFSGLTAASRMAQAIDRLTMIAPSGARSDSLISAAVATMARADRFALRRADTRFSPRLCRFLSSIFSRKAAFRSASRRAAIRASSQSAIRSRQDANLGRQPARSAPPHRCSGLSLGFVAKEGLVKLLPVGARCTHRQTAAASLRRDLAVVAPAASLRPGRAARVLSASAWRSNAAWNATAIPIARKARPSQSQNKVQDHEQDDQNRQGREGRQPFREAPTVKSARKP